MKRQNLFFFFFFFFSEKTKTKKKNNNNNSLLSSAELAQSVVKVKPFLFYFRASAREERVFQNS